MRALICVTTSNRSLAIKAFVWDYIAFCRNNHDYDFVVSLDGHDTKTIKYCNKHEIPIVSCEAQEGVGLSKNRILSAFTDYDHYFFIEDDVGLLDASVFDLHIKAAQELNVHHMSLFPEERILRKEKELQLTNGLTVYCSLFGGGTFNYFTKEGIQTVGGFHTCFARYQRFGHTEHSYRFINAGLAKYPFYVLSDCLYGYLRWSDPVSVTKIKVETVNHLFIEEQELIEQKLAHFPLMTLAPFNVPGNLNLSQAQEPLLNDINRVLFEMSLTALSAYRLIKKLWPRNNAR